MTPAPVTRGACQDAGVPADDDLERPADLGSMTELSSLLDRVVRGMGAPGTDAVELVFNRWEEVVGTVLAARTRPAGLENGRLVLVADDPAVVSHVRWLEADLLERLDSLLGAGRVTGVDVRVARRSRRG
jgi:hypothetical protein